MKKLLIIEDDYVSKLAYELTLKDIFSLVLEEDFTIITRDFGKNEFDIIMMDINLGSNAMNGIELMNLMKSTFPEVKSKFIAVTAYAQPADQNKFIELGFDGYLSKPVDFETLPAYLNQL